MNHLENQNLPKTGFLKITEKLFWHYLVLSTTITPEMASSMQEGNSTSASKEARNNPDQDWQIGKKILECNKYMFENSIECDVTFTFQPSERSEKSMEGQVLSAHKYVLISRSPVFYAMLAGPARDVSGLVSIEDIDMDSFKEMLR